MLKLGKLRETNSQAVFERVPAVELANGLDDRQRSGVASGLEAPRLHPVTAHLHVAPTSSVILARVEKEPAAGVHRARSHARRVI